MKTNINAQKIKDLLERGVEEIVDKDSLSKKLVEGKQLRVKLGIDPTAADLHLGHAVVLRKLAQFQELGHKAVLIIGDFTTLIGDPSGRVAARPKLTEAQIRNNMKDYIAQAGKVIDIKGAEIRYNSEWFGKKPMSFLMDLAGRFTVARLIEREDFQKRMKDGFDVSMLEIMYPLLQGYDSVACSADVELGGYDQRLNLLFARRVQKRFNMPEQDVLTAPLLIGADGAKKMSKSVGNYVGINEAPLVMFKKVMEIPDALIWSYFELLTDAPSGKIDELKEKIKAGLNPKEVKMELADQIVLMFRGKSAANDAKQEFIRIYQKKQPPSVIKAIKIKPRLSASTSIRDLDKIPLIDLVVATGFVNSRSAAKKLIGQNGVKIDGAAKNDWKEAVEIRPSKIIQIGKDKFCKTWEDSVL